MKTTLLAVFGIAVFVVLVTAAAVVMLELTERAERRRDRLEAARLNRSAELVRERRLR